MKFCIWAIFYSSLINSSNAIRCISIFQFPDGKNIKTVTTAELAGSNRVQIGDKKNHEHLGECIDEFAAEPRPEGDPSPRCDDLRDWLQVANNLPLVDAEKHSFCSLTTLYSSERILPGALDHLTRPAGIETKSLKEDQEQTSQEGTYKCRTCYCRDNGCDVKLLIDIVAILKKGYVSANIPNLKKGDLEKYVDLPRSELRFHVMRQLLTAQFGACKQFSEYYDWEVALITVISIIASILLICEIGYWISHSYYISNLRSLEKSQEKTVDGKKIYKANVKYDFWVDNVVSEEWRRLFEKAMNALGQEKDFEPQVNKWLTDLRYNRIMKYLKEAKHEEQKQLMYNSFSSMPTMPMIGASYASGMPAIGTSGLPAIGM